MKEKIFWRSALKASVLFYFLCSVSALLFFVFFRPTGLAELFDFFRANRELMDSLQTIVSVMAIGQVFSWVLFAWMEEKAPVKSLFAKVLVFNLGITLVSWLFMRLIPPFERVVEILLKPFNTIEANIFFFLTSTLVMYYLYDFFKKQEGMQRLQTEKSVSLASPGRRIAAYLIDVVLLTIVSVILFVVLMIAGFLGFLGTFDSVIDALIGAAVVFSVISLLIGTLYWTVLEGKFGASLGKRLLGMRIEKEGGTAIGFQEAFFRNAPKFVSGLEMFLLIELLFLLGTKKHQRLFDKVAGTVVVRK